MPNKRMLKGMVVDKHTKERYEAATVRLQPKAGGSPAFCNANEDGRFEFDVTDETTWQPGSYALTAFHPASRVEAEKELDLKGGERPAFQKIEMLSDDERSDLAGWIFGIALVGLLIGLFFGYTYLHRAFPNSEQPLDPDLQVLVELAGTQVRKTTALTTTSPVSSTIGAVETAFAALRDEPQQTLISTQKGQAVAALLSQARTAILAGDKSALQTTVDNLDEALQRTSYFWEVDPWRLLEILLWALTATMLRLVINTGFYVYKRDFHWRAIPTRLAIWVGVPVIAVLIAFVLSLVSFSFTVSGVALKVDMRNVTLSIVVAGLIGLAPWKSWEFLRGLADAFFKSLANLIPKSGADREGEGDEEPGGGGDQPDEGQRASTPRSREMREEEGLEAPDE